MKSLQPQSEAEVAEILRQANTDGAAVIPSGGGTKRDWGNAPARADVSLSLAGLNRVTEHAWADLTVTAEAGCTIAALQSTLALHGQRLAVDPLWPEQATVGGVLSTNDCGVLRFRYGGLRDLIIGVTLVLADGTIAKSGGKVVKNVAGYDLPKLVTGALGTLGVITSATFRLHPSPKNTRTVTATPANLKDMQTVLGKILDAQLVPAAVQIRAGEGPPQIDLLFEGMAEGIAAQVATLCGITPVAEASAQVWQRFDADAKISVQPSQIAAALEGLRGQAVIEGTGIGWVRAAGLSGLREKVQALGGSLVLMRPRDGMDAWGAPGTALPLMRAVKQQFDPRNTLNPGRFVGGI